MREIQTIFVTARLHFWEGRLILVPFLVPVLVVRLESLCSKVVALGLGGRTVKFSKCLG